MKLGFIGAGNMAEAILKGIIENQIDNIQKIIIFDISQERLFFLKKKYEQLEIAESSQSLVQSSDCIILSVKPQQMKDVIIEIKPIYNQQLLISIAAGLPISFYIQNMGKPIAMIRVMPNTPALVHQGISALSPSELISQEQLLIAENIFKAVGDTVICPEHQMDAITAISGSGPAYFFLFLESMYNSAQKLGLSPEIAEKLVKQTGFGACLLALKSEDLLSVLREKVTSKGGTTEAAITTLMNLEFDKIINASIYKAYNRSKEMGEMFQ